MCTSQGWKWLRLDGSTEASKRQPLVDQLNNGFGEVFAFLLSSKAGGTGLNLIGANRYVSLKTLCFSKFMVMDAMQSITSSGSLIRLRAS